MGFFVSGPYPLPQNPTPNPLSFGRHRLSSLCQEDVGRAPPAF